MSARCSMIAERGTAAWSLGNAQSANLRCSPYVRLIRTPRIAEAPHAEPKTTWNPIWTKHDSQILPPKPGSTSMEKREGGSPFFPASRPKQFSQPGKLLISTPIHHAKQPPAMNPDHIPGNTKTPIQGQGKNRKCIPSPPRDSPADHQPHPPHRKHPTPILQPGNPPTTPGLIRTHNCRSNPHPFPSTTTTSTTPTPPPHTDELCNTHHTTPSPLNPNPPMLPSPTPRPLPPPPPSKHYPNRLKPLPSSSPTTTTTTTNINPTTLNNRRPRPRRTQTPPPPLPTPVPAPAPAPAPAPSPFPLPFPLSLHDAEEVHRAGEDGRFVSLLLG